MLFLVWCIIAKLYVDGKLQFDLSVRALLPILITTYHYHYRTPTLVSGDRSNVDVVAHEIAHSAFGNLIGCYGWTHFWLKSVMTNEHVKNSDIY